MIDLKVSIPRLYAYHRALREAQAAGETMITSHGLAGLLGYTVASTQIRKDLAALGPLGRRGYGYAINPLVDQLAWVLGLEQDWRIVVAGFGNLGHAVATFITAREDRFRIAAIFDRSPSVIGQTWQGITVHDIAEMEHVLARTQCNVGVLAVPAEAAQSTAERLATCGVKALLNFAPARIELRAPMIVRNPDVAGELAILSHRLSNDAVPHMQSLEAGA